VVIGAGPAGLAAAAAAADQGASVCLAEREERMGGILKQCIHDGFGLIRFGEKLTGPEYAWRYEQMVRERPVKFLDRTFLTSLRREDEGFDLSFVNSERGVFPVRAGALVMAMGCRERTDRQIFVHGERPAGIFTAGQAQDFINLKGYMPGRRCVILGSGDIGLIMARRLTLEGAEVAGVYELGSEPSGLSRNIAQCLEDFNIPLTLDATVTRVHGRDRVEGVTVCRVDEWKNPLPETAEYIDCDCLILSVGLIPENDILTPLDLQMDPVTRGPVVDQTLETSVPGVFSCGNALHVNDLVDYVSESGEIAGEQAARYAAGRGEKDRRVPVRTEGILQYLVPQELNLSGKGSVPLFFRPSRSCDRADAVVRQDGREILRKRLIWLKPSEMHRLTLDLSQIDPAGGALEFSLKPRKTETKEAGNA